MGNFRDFAIKFDQQLKELQALSDSMDSDPFRYSQEYKIRVKRDLETAKRDYPDIAKMADEEDRQIAQLRKSLIPTQGRNKNVDQKVDKLFPSTPSDAPQPIATKNVVIGSGGNGPDFNKWHSEYNQSIQEQARRDQAARETPVSPLSPPQFQSLVSDATRTPKPVIPGTGPKMFSTTGEKTHDLNDLNATGDPAGFFDDPIQLSKNIGKQFLRGVEDHRINKMWADVSRGQFDQNEAMKIEEEFQQRALSDPIDADNWLSGILHSTARMAGHMGATMLRSTGKAAGVGLGAGGIAAATGVGSVAAPAIGLAAAGMAAPLMNYLDWHDQAAGMMYRAMVTNKETPIDPKIASVVANIVAIPYAAVEMSQINRIAPGATRLGTKAVQDVAGFSVMDNLAKAAAKQTIPSIIGKNFKEYAATWGKEMGEELVQGQIELVSNEYAKHFNNMVRGTEYELNVDDVSKMSKEMAKNLLMTAKESAGPLALMTGPRFAMKTKSELNKNKMVDRAYQKEAIELMRPIPLNLEPEKLEIIKQGIQNNEDPKQTAKKAKTSLKAVEDVKKTLSEPQGETIIPDGQLPVSDIPVQPEQADQTIPGIVDNGQNISIGKEGVENVPADILPRGIPDIEPQPAEITTPMAEPQQQPKSSLPAESSTATLKPWDNAPAERENDWHGTKVTIKAGRPNIDYSGPATVTRILNKGKVIEAIPEGQESPFRFDMNRFDVDIDNLVEQQRPQQQEPVTQEPVSSPPVIQQQEDEFDKNLINAQKIEHDALIIAETNTKELDKLPDDIKSFIYGIGDVGLDKALVDGNVDDYYVRFNKILNDYPNLLTKYRATDPNYMPQKPSTQKPVSKNTGNPKNQNTYSSAIKNSIVGATINHGKIKWSDVKSLLGKNVAENIVNPKKFVLEITSPNGVSLDEIADDLINRGELHINPNKQNDEHYLEILIDRWNRIQNGDYFNENSQNPTEVDYNAELEHTYGADVHEKIKNAKIIVYGTNDIRTYKTKLEYDRAGESPQLWKSAKKEKGKYIIIDEDLGLTPERNTRQPGMFGQEESSEELPFLVKQTQQKSGKSEFVKSGGPVASVQTEKDPAGSKHWISSDLVSGTQKGRVMTVNDLIKNVRNIFPNMVFRPKGFRKMGSAAGLYQRGTSYIRTRNDKDIQAITHELAHSLHYLKTKYETWSGNKDFQNELIGLDYHPNRTDKKLAIIEGFAEFARLWATGDPNLAKKAPKFLEYFENQFLKEHDKDGQWTDLKDLLNEYRNQDTEEYYKAGLVRSETWFDRSTRRMNDFVKKWSIHPIDKARMAYAQYVSRSHDNARSAETMIKIALGRAYHQLAYKDRFIEIWRMTQGRAGECARRVLFEKFINPITGETYGNSMADVFRSCCKNQDDMLEFERYLKAKQLSEIYENKDGNYILPHGEPIEHLREAIDRIESSRPEFIEGRQKYKEFNDNLLKMVFDAGGFSQDLYESLKNTFSAWVPIEHEKLNDEFIPGSGKGTGKAYANIAQPVHSLKEGSEAPLTPLINAYSKHVEKMIAFASKVRAVRSLLDIQDISGEMGEEIKAGLSKIVRVTDAPTSVKNISAEKLIETLTDAGYKVTPGENKTKMDEILNLFFSDYLPKNSKFGTVMVFKNGKPVYLELEKELYNLLMAQGEGLNYTGTNAVLKLFNKAGKMVRFGATTMKLSFTLWSNLISDTINRITASDQLLSNPFQTFNGILAELVRKGGKSEFFEKLGIPTEMAQKYLASGGAFSTQLGADAQALYDMQNQFKGAVTENSIMFSVRHPFEAARAFLSFTENANRIADFKEVYNKVLKQTGDEEEAYIRSVRSSQDVTIDFMRHGEWTQFMSLIKAFYNAQAQGLSKAARNITELKPSKYGKDANGRLIVESNRSKGAYFIPKVVAWHLGMNILQRVLMPEDKKKEFDEMPGYMKHGFWHFWIKGHHLFIPCKFIQGAIVNGAINLTMPPMAGKRFKEEKIDWVTHLWNESFAGILPFPNIQQFMSGVNILGAFIDISANKDVFGVPIEPTYARQNESDRLKIVNDKTYDITKSITKGMHKIGENVPAFSFMGDISPIQMQYFLGKITGGSYWRAGAWVQLFKSTIAGKTMELEKAPVLGTLFRQDNPLQRRPVRKFYENIKSAMDNENYPNREIYKSIQREINGFERIYKANKAKPTPKTIAELKGLGQIYKVDYGQDKEMFRKKMLYEIINKGMTQIGDY